MWMIGPQGETIPLEPVTPITDEQSWGPWQFHADILTLLLTDKDGLEYEIDLEGITDSATMLDWIFQIRMKTWATDEIVGCLVTAFSDLFSPQANLCSFGKNKTIDPKQHFDSLLAT